jgi:hypothetical protein
MRSAIASCWQRILVQHPREFFLRNFAATYLFSSVAMISNRLPKTVTKAAHLSDRQGDAAFANKITQGAGRPFTGACASRVNIGKGLSLCAFMCIAAPAELWASAMPLPSATSFAYSVSHPVTPLPAAVIERIVNTDGRDSDEADAFDTPHPTRVDVRIGAPRALSRNSMCNAIVSVARANDLPIPFFANLIWQESSFNVKTISRAGALGVAQYMPETAKEQGLINPFEPIHALHVAGKFLRQLHGQFGNLGLAAAAYNAGPGRVSRWIAKRGGLPGETRNYVVRITGRQAEQWTSSEFARGPEATLMPAKAPCAEVAEAVEAQGKIVRVNKLMSELAAATKVPPRDDPKDEKFDEMAWTNATEKPEWRLHALNVVRGALRNISEKKAREASAKKHAGKNAMAAVRIDTKKSNEAKTEAKIDPKLARAWSRIAERTMRKAAEEFADDPVEKVQKRGASRGTHVAYSR